MCLSGLKIHKPARSVGLPLICIDKPRRSVAWDVYANPSIFHVELGRFAMRHDRRKYTTSPLIECEYDGQFHREYPSPQDRIAMFLCVICGCLCCWQDIVHVPSRCHRFVVLAWTWSGRQPGALVWYGDGLLSGYGRCIVCGNDHFGGLWDTPTESRRSDSRRWSVLWSLCPRSCLPGTGAIVVRSALAPAYVLWIGALNARRRLPFGGTSVLGNASRSTPGKT